MENTYVTSKDIVVKTGLKIALNLTKVYFN